jgi:predicted AAA+ superfamily ATPase
VSSLTLPQATLCSPAVMKIQPSGLAMSMNNAGYNEVAFENLLRFLSDAIGTPVSSKSIADYFLHTKDRIDDKTISRYISILNKSYLFYHANRFDLKGKKILKTQGKEYIVVTASADSNN